MHFSLISQNISHNSTYNCYSSSNQMNFHDQKLNRLSVFKKYFKTKINLKQRISTHQSLPQSQYQSNLAQYIRSQSLAGQKQEKKSFFGLIQKQNFSSKKEQKIKNKQKNVTYCNITNAIQKFKMTKRETKIKYMKQLNVSKMNISQNKVRIHENQIILKKQKLLYFYSKHKKYEQIKSLNLSQQKKPIKNHNKQTKTTSFKQKNSTVELNKFCRCLLMKTKIVKDNKKNSSSQIEQNQTKLKNFQNINVNFNVFLPSIHRSQSPLRGWNVQCDSNNDDADIISLVRQNECSKKIKLRIGKINSRCQMNE